MMRNCPRCDERLEAEEFEDHYEENHHPLEIWQETHGVNGPLDLSYLDPRTGEVICQECRDRCVSIEQHLADLPPKSPTLIDKHKGVSDIEDYKSKYPEAPIDAVALDHLIGESVEDQMWFVDALLLEKLAYKHKVENLEYDTELIERDIFLEDP